ncbi:MAG: hypothetical protein LBO67_04740 [Spirochaetaceae bacterium]|jgi:uncharacterized protein with gpF-like domain|nr:hypothetical protein [Spirochaetaceae bacterium]
MGLGNIADSVFDFNEGQYEKGAKSVLGVEFPVGEDWWPQARDTWASQNYDNLSDLMKKYIGQVRDFTEKAVTSGLSVKTLSEQIQALDNKFTKSHADFIARDQIGKLNGQITQQRMESVGLRMYIWETSGDERVRGNPIGKYPNARPSHYLMDGRLCRWDKSTVYSQDGGKTWIPPPSGAVLLHPGMDYQCFPGSTKIESFFDNERIYQRVYHGPTTALITAKGKINCTPNHPILTDKGWRPAELINIGDRIVKVKGEGALADSANPQNSITTFDELFGFFSVFLNRERISLGNEDFHGDISVDQKVNIITTKSVLRNYVKTDIDEAFFQKIFSEADTMAFGECEFVSDLFRDCLSFHCGMGFFSKANSFLGSGMGHSDDHAIRAIAWVQSVLNKATVDGSPGCSELFRNSLDTHAGLKQFAYFLFWELFSVMRRVIVMNGGISPPPHGNIKIAMKDSFELGNLADIHSSGIEFDTVIDKVIVSDYEGHIYNLQNTHGWYMVSSEHYIVKNCRCTATAYWQELVGEADQMLAQYWEPNTVAAQNIAVLSKPMLQPKKLVTQKILQGQVSDLDKQIKALENQYSGAIVDNGSPADKQLYADLQSKKAEIQAEIEKKKLAAQKNLLTKKIKKFEKELEDIQIKTYSGIWKDDVTVEDYADKAAGIQAKKDYFIGKLNNETLSESDKVKLTLFLQDLDEFEAEGKHYVAIQTAIKDAKGQLTALKKGSTLKKEDNPYSQERKDAALWAKNPKDADSALRDVCGEVWKSASLAEREAIYAYTEGSGGFNRPLRGYDGSWQNFKGVGKVPLDNEGRADAIKKMTKLINRSEYDFDVWLQRGVATVDGVAAFLGITEDNLRHWSQAQFQKHLIESKSEITDPAFFSCGSSKGKGFSGYIFNIYCPKGTKMMYAEPFSHYGEGDKLHWDWEELSNERLDGIAKQSGFGYEDETIIQRGTTFRIIKVEKKRDTIFFDIEVVKQIEESKNYGAGKKTALGK